MRLPSLLLAAFGLSGALSLQALGGTGDKSSRDALTACRSINNAGKRLACYDAAVLNLTAPNFEGRLSLSTETFEILVPTRLRFQSDGVIFVLYLKDAQGEVLQNLHIGGGGEDTYLIETPGTYSLQINGSESWRVWLEPLHDAGDVAKETKKSTERM